MKARLLKLVSRVPLGERLSAVLRSSRLAWMRCFPGVRPQKRFASFFRLAYEAWAARDVVLALHFLRKAEAALPGSPRVAFLRGFIHHHHGRWELATSDLLAVVRHPEAPSQEKSVAHRRLADMAAARGDLDEGYLHALASFEDDSESETAASEAWSLLAEMVINEHGRLDLAEECLRKRDEFRSTVKCVANSGKPGAVILTDDWVRNIGHLAMLDGQVKLQKLGHVSEQPIVLLAPTEKVANAPYLRHWKQHVQVVDDPGRLRELAPLASAIGLRVSSFWPIGANQIRYFMEAMGCVQLQWEARGFAPLLELDRDCEEQGSNFLRRQGVPEGAWFVGLHAREPGFHGETDTQRNRDVNIETYRPAIEAITQRGGWVVRLGNQRMRPLPRMKQVLDYAHSPDRRPEIDVFLCARSRFFIGTASGLVHVPFTFGVPCVLSNWVSNAMIPPFGGGDLYIPKRLRDIKTARLLTWEQQCAPAIRNLHFNYHMMQRQGMDVVDNSPQELQDVVKEMLDRLEGDAVCDGDDVKLQTRVKEIARSQGLDAPPRMGRTFARKILAEVPNC